MTIYRPMHLLIVATLLASFSAVAQEPAARAAAAPKIPADEFDRGTPLRAAEGFLAAVDQNDYAKAAEYLDLRNLRGEASDLTGAELSRQFFVIIKRADWLDVSELVDDPAGRMNDNLPSYRDSIGVVLDEGKEVRLLMQKVPRGDGVSIWKVSNATVSLIPKLYATYGYPPLVEQLRRSLPDRSFLGFEMFKWVIVVAVGVVAYLAMFLVGLVVRGLLRSASDSVRQRVYRFLVLPAAIWAAIMSMNAAATSLGRSATAELIGKYTPIPVLLTIWMLFVATNLFRDIYAARLQQRDRPGAAVLLRPATNAIKLVIAIGGVLVYMGHLGINITTVLAGLGVGGIAIALALQKPMEDVFGAVTLFSQQPVRVGDFCRVGAETGTIEEIGLRTTRIRTLANTVIAIPNSKLASEPIDNISARNKILFRPTLRLRYDTSPQQLQQILEGIRELLRTHEQVLQDNHRVRLKEISSDALLVEVFAYLETTEWAYYLELAEGLNLRILDIVARAGTSLTPPARTLHIEQQESKPPAGHAA